jgi:hypothetical protein
VSHETLPALIGLGDTGVVGIEEMGPEQHEWLK